MKTILMGALFACMIYAGYSIAFADEPVYKNHVVIVNAGDTLWDIAGRCTGNGEDIRQVMFRISEANGLVNAHIYPGQALQVPMAVESSALYVAER